MRAFLSSILALTAAGALAAPAGLDPLPAQKADGDLKVTIRELKLIPPPGGGDPNDLSENSWTKVGVRLDWGGRSTKDWRLADVLLTDVRGVVYKPRRISTFFRASGEGEVRLSGPVWNASEPWKVRLAFARSSSTPFAVHKDRVFEFTAVPTL